MGEIGLWFITYMPEVRMHLIMMIALVERWHSETSSFHILTSEIGHAHKRI